MAKRVEIKTWSQKLLICVAIVPTAWLIITAGNIILEGLTPYRSGTPSLGRDRQFKLVVPLVQQQELFECNLAAAAMVLNYYNIPATKEELFAELPKEQALRDNVRNTWGDPEQGFVGHINGEGGGYGVHWQPVEKLLSRYRPVETKRNWNLSELLKSVENGIPAILWWQNGSTEPKDISWTTPGGKQIRAVDGMHSEVVVGFVGTPETPRAIILNDPWRGERQVAPAEFSQLWNYYDNTALLVY